MEEWRQIHCLRKSGGRSIAYGRVEADPLPMEEWRQIHCLRKSGGRSIAHGRVEADPLPMEEWRQIHCLRKSRGRFIAIEGRKNRTARAAWVLVSPFSEVASHVCSPRVKPILSSVQFFESTNQTDTQNKSDNNYSHLQHTHIN